MLDLFSSQLAARGLDVEKYSAFWFTALGATVFVLAHPVAAWFCQMFSTTYQKMDWKNKQQYRMHLVSLIHAAVGGWHGVLVFMEDPFVQKPEYMFRPPFMCKAIVAFHLGYFFQDFWVTLFQHKAIGDTATYIHHISVGSAFFLCVKEDVAVWITGSLLANEVTGPFLHARWFIRKYNLGGTWTEGLNSFLLVTSYAVFRLLLTVYQVGNGAWYQKYMFGGSADDISLYKKVCVDVLWVPMVLQCIMNVYWFKKIIKFSAPIVRLAEFLGVMRLKDAPVVKRVQGRVHDISQSVENMKESAGAHVSTLKRQTVDTLQETVEHVKIAGKSGVETFLDSQSEKPKSSRALQLQTAFRFITWIGGAVLFCTDIARRSRSYSQPVEIFCYIIALLMLVLGMFALFFNNNDEQNQREKLLREDGLRNPQASSSKVKVN